MEFKTRNSKSGLWYFVPCGEEGESHHLMSLILFQSSPLSASSSRSQTIPYATGCRICYWLYTLSTHTEWTEKLGLRNLYNNFPRYYKCGTAHSSWQQVLVSWNSGNCRYLNVRAMRALSDPHLCTKQLHLEHPAIPLCPGAIFQLWPHQQPCSCCSLAIKTLKKYHFFSLESWF